MKKITEKMLITRIGLLLSLIGGIIAFLYGIKGYGEPIFGAIYDFRFLKYDTAFFISVLAIVGAIAGFIDRVGVGIDLVFIIICLILILGMKSEDIMLIFSSLYIIIGGITTYIGYF